MTSANVHASCIVCAAAGAALGAPGDAGVLLLGDSGSYKSDLALRLVAMGARLVADDRCEMFFDGKALRVRPPGAIAGLMEIRGVGIISMPFVPEARVALAARLQNGPARLPERRRYSPPGMGVPERFCPPEISVAAAEASAPAKILAAVAAYEKQLFREEIAT